MSARRVTALVAALLLLGAAVAASAFAGTHTAAGAGGSGPHRRARSSRTPTVTVTAALQRLLRGGALTEASYRQYTGAYVAATRSLSRLSGTRALELGAVLANVRTLAGAGELTPSRLPVVFLTLERNRQWWTTEPLLSSGERVSFPDSRLVWEYYAGQGIEIQWLATFGEGNGYYLSGNENGNLRALLAEAIPLATQRAGGIAWEYMFEFDGGRPPWISGLSQGTALQLLARAYSRFHEASYLTAAQQALAVFEHPPPQGVRVATPAGAMYAEYSFAPSDHILNGFIQALVGLYDYAALTHEPAGLALFEAGDAEARAEVPHYDTGAWSLYDQFGESDLNYHELLTEFLAHLCERTRRGLPFTPPAPPASPPPTTTTPTPPPTGEAGGSAPGAAAARAAQAQAQAPIPGDAIYCTTAQHFETDLTTPPRVSLLSSSLPGGARAGVQISLSKVSLVTLTVRHGTRVVWTNTATLERGRPRLLWVTPSGGGTFTATLAARDLAGNFATTSGTVTVRHR